MNPPRPQPKPTKKPKAPPKRLERSRMRRKSPRRIAKETLAEKLWKARVHERPCVGQRSELYGHHCDGPIQQMHLRNPPGELPTGMGRKEHNLNSLPGCQRLHYDYDNALGPFAPMGRTGRKNWFLARLIEERADWYLEHGYPIEAALQGTD